MKQSELSTNSGINHKDCFLINGDFDPSDAKEIISHLILKKIDFHASRNFSSEIRFGKMDEHSLKRCEELKKSKAEIGEFIQKAKDEGRQVRVKSNISIELI